MTEGVMIVISDLSVICDSVSTHCTCQLLAFLKSFEIFPQPHRGGLHSLKLSWEWMAPWMTIFFYEKDQTSAFPLPCQGVGVCSL